MNTSHYFYIQDNRLMNIRSIPEHCWEEIVIEQGHITFDISFAKTSESYLNNIITQYFDYRIRCYSGIKDEPFDETLLSGRDSINYRLDPLSGFYLVDSLSLTDLKYEQFKSVSDWGYLEGFDSLIREFDSGINRSHPKLSKVIRQELID